MKKQIRFLTSLFVLMLWIPILAHAEGKAVSRNPISAEKIQKTIADAELLENKVDLLEAKKRLTILFRHDLEKSDKKKVKKALESINMKILFSPIETSGSLIYTVQEGDSLHKIAKKYGTTIGLIKRTNHLTKDVIRPGMKFKIIKGKFSILIDKSDNKLKLFCDDELIKTYSVTTGANNSTPIGTFTIEMKLENPTWYTTGAIVPPNSPENVLGTRWMGFSIPEYGIHGTTEPEAIGKQTSKGCVRMRNEEVEELYDIVPLKTTVTVVD